MLEFKPSSYFISTKDSLSNFEHAIFHKESNIYIIFLVKVGVKPSNYFISTENSLSDFEYVIFHTESIAFATISNAGYRKSTVLFSNLP